MLDYDLKNELQHVNEKLKLTKEEIQSLDDFNALSEEELIELSEFVYSLSNILYKINGYEQP